jgi:hypothetical protein
LNVARAAWTTLGACVCAALTLATTRMFGIQAAIAAVVVSFVLVDLLYAASLRAALRRRSLTAAETPVGSHPEAQRP